MNAAADTCERDAKAYPAQPRFGNLLHHALLSFAVFSLIFDSGGELGLRTIGLLILVAQCVIGRRNFSVSRQELEWSAALIVSVLPALLVSATKAVPLATMLVWTFPVLAFPLILCAVRAIRLCTDHFVNGGALFACVIIVLFVGRVLDIEAITAVHDVISERAAGFFNKKQAFFEEATPVVYFQGTLILVLTAILAVGRQRPIMFLMSVIGLLLAPSRFGLTIALLFGLPLMVVQLRRGRAALVVAVAIALIGAVTALPASFLEIFSSEGSGSQTRLLHVKSMIEHFDAHPHILLTGDGPGISFYSEGFQSWTDNIEISHLELVRKFGILFPCILVAMQLWACRRLFERKNPALALSLIAHQLVALSNPVLLSLPAVILFALAFATANDL